MKILRIISTSLIVAALSIAFAQSSGVSVGGYTIPDALWFALAPFVGILVNALASPITALVKKHGGTEDAVTRGVHVVVVVVLTVILGLASRTIQTGADGLIGLLLVAAGAVVRGWGVYERTAQATRRGVEQAAAPFAPTLDPPTSAGGLGDRRL